MTQPLDVKTLLNLRVPPVAIGLSGEPPPGVARYVDAPTASGCTFWQFAQQGHVFYTSRGPSLRRRLVHAPHEASARRR